ncbi:MAG: PTS transporter subunit IIC [Oscillospiraceae bacterium]|nr:PTS transporter subunit IIC [Oscillospiraceae bacterium]
MEAIVNAFSFISNLGSTIMVPLFILIIGLIFKLGFVKSMRSALTVGAGFIGMNLILNIIWVYMIPISDALRDKFGFDRPYYDAGGGAAGVIAFGTTVGTIIIPFIILLNIILIVTKVTKTINIDIWNFWHFAFTGSVVTIMTQAAGAGNTESVIYGLIAAGTHCVLSLLIADMTAPRVQEEFGMPGVSISQGFATSTVPLLILLDKLYDKIAPKSKGESEKVKKAPGKLASLFAEPIIIGFILGILLGFAGADYSAGAGAVIKTVLTLGVELGALMLLLPRMIKVIVEGLLPVSDAVRKYVTEKHAGREFYIGLDSAVLLGHPNTLIVSVLLIPIVIILSIIMPWNTTLPLADLAATAFFVSMATPIHRGSFWKTLVSGTIIFAIVLSLSSFFGPMITQAAISTGYAFPEGAQGITALSAGNMFAWIIAMIMKLKYVGAILCGALIAATIYFINKVAYKLYDWIPAPAKEKEKAAK